MALQSITPAAKGAPADRWDDNDLIPVEIPRDQWDRPLIVPPGGGEPVGYVRASSLGNCLEFEGGLHRWEQRHLFVNVAKSPDLIVSGQSVEDADDPATKKDIGKWVKIALEPTKAKARIGTALHRLTEQVDATGQIPQVGVHVPALTAYRDVMSAWFEVLYSEAFLVNDELGSAGTTDRIVRLLVWMQPCDRDGKPVGEPLPPGTILVLDLKTSGTAKYFGAKFCTQLKVYQGGLLYDPRTGARTAIEGVNERWALILHMPSGGRIAELYWVDLAVGAYAAELAVEVRAVDKAGKQAIARAVIEPWTDTPPRGEDGALVPTSPSPVVAVPRPTFAGQIFDTVTTGVKTQHDYRKLMELIGQCLTETALLELYRTNWRIWTEAHTVRAGERSAFLAQRAAS